MTNKETMQELKAAKQLEIRFSEVDSMGVVWHGAYAKYFEDAREEFGRKYNLGYMLICRSGCFAPVVELTCKYRKPLLYEMNPIVEITYRPTDAAKIVFDYAILSAESGEVYATGHSVQVFTDTRYNLMWSNPAFYEEWKQKWLK